MNFNETLIKFLFFFATGVVLISSIGIVYMLFNSYEFWDIFWSAITLIVAASGAYYIYRKVTV